MLLFSYRTAGSDGVLLKCETIRVRAEPGKIIDMKKILNYN